MGVRIQTRTDQPYKLHLAAQTPRAWGYIRLTRRGLIPLNTVCINPV